MVRVEISADVVRALAGLLEVEVLFRAMCLRINTATLMLRYRVTP